MGRSLQVVVFLVLHAAGISFASAQMTTAVLRGRVIDREGTGLPGVVLLVTSERQPSGNSQAVSDIEGNYRIAPLPSADDWHIRIDYPGFARTEIGPVRLDEGATTVVNVTLSTDAETTDVVHVVDTGDIVETDSGVLVTHFDTEFIQGLPLIGHSVQDLLALVPGVTDTDGDGNPNVLGARSTGMQIRLDGVNITDPVSGTFGQNVNQDIIEEVEIRTAGATADFGRTDGGFTSIITRSGGNEFEGKLSVFWQGKFLNGEGPGNNDTNGFEGTVPDYHDVRTTLSLGGPIVKDRLWYFGSVQVLDTQRPVNQVGANILVTSRGNNSFAKLTWQVDSLNRLALQASSDPRTFRGLGLALGTSPDSDFRFSQGGFTPQLKWTATLSPRLLLEAQVSRFNSGIALTPVSRYFEPTPVSRFQSGTTIQALYPCGTVNCDPSSGERRIYQTDLITGIVTGPFNLRTDDKRGRTSLKTDLSYTVEDAMGQHNIRSGIEFADESFEDRPVTNPLLIDVTVPFQPPPGSGGGTVALNQISGVQVLQTFDPLETRQSAGSFNGGFYILDAWKPRPGLTINAGVRFDREDIDSSGFEDFDPRVERRRAISLWNGVCAEARVQGIVGATSNCNDQATYDARPPTGLPDQAGSRLKSFRDDDGDAVNDVAPSVASLDLDGDGEISTSGAEGLSFFRDFTRFGDRETRNFEIVNSNLSPRLSISWDPWGDGATKLFGNWGRFYDRLFLATVTGEIGPDNVNYAFTPDQNHVIVPGAVSRAASTVSITQIDRDLATPYTDELSLGFERELASEWSVGLTWIRRRGSDLLQDTDINHVTCGQFRSVLGVDPALICGDAGGLETDRFGQVGFDPASPDVEGGSFAFNRAYSLPNGAPDLYTVNNGFNQVLRIGNVNSSDFTAWEARLVRRQHHGWQMQASYTWSKASGQAEAFGSVLGNDPETVDDEEGYLIFDQRHVLKFQAVTQLPAGIGLGTIVQWASGTPFSLTRTVVDQDSTGNTIFRSFFPSGRRNDQRNGGQWRIDAHLERSFIIRKVRASGFLNVQNLLNGDELVVTSYDLTALNGVGLNAIRNTGRRFEIGASFAF